MGVFFLNIRKANAMHDFLFASDLKVKNTEQSQKTFSWSAAFTNSAIHSSVLPCTMAKDYIQIYSPQ